MLDNVWKRCSIQNPRNQPIQSDLVTNGKLDELKDLQNRLDGCKFDDCK